MNASEAYEHAVSLWGNDAGVWRAPGQGGAAGRCLVGFWAPVEPLGETATPPAGYALVTQGRVREEIKALKIMGEGATWAEAFKDARTRGTEDDRAREAADMHRRRMREGKGRSK